MITIQKYKGLRLDGLGYIDGFYIRTPLTAEFHTDNSCFANDKIRHCIVDELSGCVHEVNPETIVESRQGTGTYVININNKQFTVWGQFITGRYLKELAGCDPYISYIYLEKGEDELDVQLSDNETIDLSQPNRVNFYTLSRH